MIGPVDAGDGVDGAAGAEWDPGPALAILSRFPGQFRQFRVKDPAAMSSVCDVCGKKPQFGKNVSHSHRRTNRRWNPNVQKIRAIVDGSPKRVHVCTSCLKAGKVVKP